MFKIDIDSKINEYLIFISVTQNNYKKLKNRYLQALESHSSIPMYGKSSVPQTNVKPSDVNENWSDLCAYPANMDYSLRIDVYETEKDKGCRLLYQTREGNAIWQKIIPIFGPDVSIQDWHQIDELMTV